MHTRSRSVSLALIAAGALVVPLRGTAQAPGAPLVIGETFTIESDVLGETRRINVYRPGFVDDTVRLPVLYMPDGGVAEDFLHIAGLVQVLTGNGSMVPVLLVGIENTQRRRDLTGPTDSESDRRIAPVVGGSAAFRTFIRDELRPEVDRRYATSGSSGIVGESLAGLFVIETLLVEPRLFDTYIAVDPSLWWNDTGLLDEARHVSLPPGRRLYLASSSEPGLSALALRLADLLRGATGLTLDYLPLADETHATIFHPAALRAFRTVFAVPAESP